MGFCFTTTLTVFQPSVVGLRLLVCALCWLSFSHLELLPFLLSPLPAGVLQAFEFRLLLLQLLVQWPSWFRPVWAVCPTGFSCSGPSLVALPPALRPEIDALGPTESFPNPSSQQSQLKHNRDQSSN